MHLLQDLRSSQVFRPSSFPQAAGRSLSVAWLVLLMALPLGGTLAVNTAHADVVKVDASRERSDVRRQRVRRGRVAQRRGTARRHTTVRRRTTVHRTRVYRRPVASRTTIIHHHAPGTRVVSSADQGPVVRTMPRRRDGPYFNMGLGVVSIDNSFDDGVGSGLNLALGMRMDDIALELGLLGGAQPIELEGGELVQDLSFGGISGDVRYFLPIGRVLEPYLQAGVGLYSVGVDEEALPAPAVNLGGGVDLRLTRDIAIGGRYLYRGFFFESPESEAGQTDGVWSAMGTFTYYF